MMRRVYEFSDNADCFVCRGCHSGPPITGNENGCAVYINGIGVVLISDSESELGNARWLDDCAGGHGGAVFISAMRIGLFRSDHFAVMALAEESCSSIGARSAWGTRCCFVMVRIQQMGQAVFLWQVGHI
jgi:hypothetical protein